MMCAKRYALVLILTVGFALPIHAVAQAAPDAPDAGDGALTLTVTDAVLMALENNRALAVERITPKIRETQAEELEAPFDPNVEASLSVGKTRGQRQLSFGPPQVDTTTTTSGRLALSQFFPTGTSVTAELTTDITDSSLYPETFTASRAGLTVTQALLRGIGSDVNKAQLRKARLAARISAYELRGVSQSLVADVENAYWDYSLAGRQIEIVEESLVLAKQQLRETEEMIKVGLKAEAERVAQQAEVAIQFQARIDARSAQAKARLQLLRLINPPGDDLWDREIRLAHPPELPDVMMDDVVDHEAVALLLRPEVNQAKLAIRQGDLEVVRTRNGLLPKLDLFITLGASGYADSFGDSVSDIDGDNYDARAGLEVAYPFFNRSAKAQDQRAKLTLEQSRQALANLEQLVAVDVRAGFIEVTRTKEQIAASMATRRLEEEKLRIETEKFRVGRSTNILVAQAQRDLLRARIAEVEAVVGYIKALTAFYRQEGSLLTRRGIEAPGKQPIILQRTSE